MRERTIKGMSKVVVGIGTSIFLIGVLMAYVPSTEWVEQYNIQEQRLERVDVRVYPLREYSAHVLVLSNILVLTGFLLYSSSSKTATGDAGVYCNWCGGLVPSHSSACRYCGHKPDAQRTDEKERV